MIADAVQPVAAIEMFDLMLKLLIALVGFYLAHSLGRQVALRVSEKRLSAYATLWELTGLASPVRLQKGAAGPLTKKERLALHDDLSRWYYTDGKGMLLAHGTRTMFLMAKDNLVFDPEGLKRTDFKKRNLTEFQKEVARTMDAEQRDRAHGERAIQQLSLLRTRMKADLGVFGIHYGGGLTSYDEAFLIDCGEFLWRRPWRRPFRQFVKDIFR